MKKIAPLVEQNLVHIPIDADVLEGELVLPSHSLGVVLFAHGSGSSRKSPRNCYVADILRQSGIGTLLFDLLTEKEDQVYAARFDIELLTRRLVAATRWVMEESAAKELPVGYFGASTGAAAALRAAARLGPTIKAVVSRGGRPDLAFAVLERVTAATLLVVGGYDHEVIRLNRKAYERLSAVKDIVVVPGATHLFEEPGTLEEVARLAAEWFLKHLQKDEGDKKSSIQVSDGRTEIKTTKFWR
ncbi:MAG TPA: dienelactone hydrolase family protein [Verrucomicrobiae bacterium]|nr:dienelactone hydrolase family protein [Verrucomicrobiae bacterium]